MAFVSNYLYLGEFPKVWIEEGMASFGDWVEETLPYEFLASLLSGGIIAGVGAVLSFLPHILILFLVSCFWRAADIWRV